MQSINDSHYKTKFCLRSLFNVKHPIVWECDLSLNRADHVCFFFGSSLSFYRVCRSFFALELISSDITPEFECQQFCTPAVADCSELITTLKIAKLI